MDLLPTDEQAEIADQVRSFLAKEIPIRRVRELATRPSMLDAELWRRLADLGWFGLALPEAQGGAGFGLPEEVLLFREVGRHLTPGPILATVLAARVAAEAGDGQLAAAFLAGEAAAALGHLTSPGRVGPLVDGEVVVLDGPGASHLLVVSPDGAALVALDMEQLAAAPCVDGATRLGRLSLTGTPALAHVAGAELWQRGAALAAAVCCGLAEAVRDDSAAYASTRHQFGQPIGAFQAVKHRCSDMAVRAEAAFSQLCFATAAIEAGRADAGFHVASAKLLANDAATTGAADNIQNHGGMGFTAEQDSQLYVKRAYVYEHVFGAPRDHAVTILDATVIDASA